MTPQNESAVSFKWLKEQVILGNNPNSQAIEIWERIKKQMRNVDQVVISLQDWISDYWICKGAQVQLNFAAKWAPPDDLDEWPTMDVQFNDALSTNHDSFLKILSSAKVDLEFDSDNAVQEFYLLDGATQFIGDTAMHQAQYVRAWLFTAFGPLLMSIALSPQHNTDQLFAETRRRLLIPRQFIVPKWAVWFSEGELEILYNCRLTANGNLSTGTTQIGQGEEWMRHWQWLSKSITSDQALTSVQLAARLLRSKPLLEGLLDALNSKNTNVEELSIAVIRRWLLTLKAMTWLENALKCNWKFVRPQDLACLAYNALKPEWPRRLFAVSHRSFEVKPLLQQTRAWDSPLFAIDAIYVPAWETNTGMIWGLFANTPIITIVDSPNYSASEWCQREAELIRHLQMECDFRSDRFIRVIKSEEVSEFSTIDENWYANNATNYNPRFRTLTSFPPQSMVFVPQKNVKWELCMLRAAGALRIFNACFGDPELANMLAQFLLSDGFNPIPCPTNQPNGWDEYKKIFRDLALECEVGSKLHLWFPKETLLMSADEMQKFVDKIPDLSTGNPALSDVLVAVEWLHSLLPILEDENLGDMILIDLRDTTKEIWETDPGFSMARGIASLRQPPRPVWFIQHAKQEIEKWGLLGGDKPIFTQHTENQFSWMLEGSFSPEWPSTYVDRSGLELSEELLLKCLGTKRDVQQE